jgi:hypothetical protein
VLLLLNSMSDVFAVSADALMCVSAVPLVCLSAVTLVSAAYLAISVESLRLISSDLHSNKRHSHSHLPQSLT